MRGVIRSCDHVAELPGTDAPAALLRGRGFTPVGQPADLVPHFREDSKQVGDSRLLGIGHRRSLAEILQINRFRAVSKSAGDLELPGAYPSVLSARCRHGWKDMPATTPSGPRLSPHSDSEGYAGPGARPCGARGGASFTVTRSPVRARPKKICLVFTANFACIGGLPGRAEQSRRSLANALAQPEAGALVMSRLPNIDQPRCEKTTVSSYISDRDEKKRIVDEIDCKRRLAIADLNSLRKKYAKQKQLFTPGVDFVLKLLEDFKPDSARHWLRGFDVAREVADLDARLLELCGEQTEMFEEDRKGALASDLAQAVA